MKKQVYVKPALLVMTVRTMSIMAGTITGTDGNAGLNYGGASSNAGANPIVRSRNTSIWDDEDE